jgi:predicted PurR-regulated permease PerM
MPDNGGGRLPATLIAIFAVGLLLFFVRSVVEIAVLLFISVLLAAYFSAVTDLLVRILRAPRAVSLILAVVVTGLALAGVGALVVPPVATQTQELIAALPDLGRRLDTAVGRLAALYPELGRAAFRTEDGTFVEALLSDATDFVRGSLGSYLTAGGKLAVEIFSVFAMGLYLAFDPKGYKEGVISLVPPKVRHIARTTLTDLENTLRAWIAAQLLAMIVLAVLTGIGLWALRVPYPLAFAVFTGLAALVPFFGTIVSTLLPALVVLAAGGVGKAFAVLLLGVGVHLVEANVVAPLIFQERIKLPPVLTILSILVMATVLGVLGLIVAVPLLAITMVILRHVLIGEIYGTAPAVETPAVLVPTQEHRRFSLPSR